MHLFTLYLKWSSCLINDALILSSMNISQFFSCYFLQTIQKNGKIMFKIFIRIEFDWTYNFDIKIFRYASRYWVRNYYHVLDSFWSMWEMYIIYIMMGMMVMKSNERAICNALEHFVFVFFNPVDFLIGAQKWCSLR